MRHQLTSDKFKIEKKTDEMRKRKIGITVFIIVELVIFFAVIYLTR